MSRNDYRDIEFAFTPTLSSNAANPDIRGRLFFKMHYDQSSATLTASLTPKWLQNDVWTPGTAAQRAQEVANFLATNDNEMGAVLADEIQIKVIEAVNRIKDRATSNLRSRMLALFDQVYTFNVPGVGVAPARRFQANTTGVIPTTIGVVVAVRAPVLPGVGGVLSYAVRKALYEVNNRNYFFRNRFNDSGGTALAVQPVGVIGGANKTWTFREDRFIYRALHGDATTRTTADIYSALTGSVPGVGPMSQSVRRNKNGKWEIKDPATNKYTDLETYVGSVPRCDIMASNAGTPACNTWLTTCAGPDAYKSIIGINGGTANGTCLNDLLVPGNWKFMTTGQEGTLKQIDPAVAFWILKGLGFQGKQANNGHVNVEPVSDWFKRFDDDNIVGDDNNRVDLTVTPAGLAGGAGTTIKAAITTARTTFTKFLGMLVSYVNSNPDILNGKGAVAQTPNDDPYGLQRPVGDDVHRQLHDLRNVVNNSLGHVRFRVNGLLHGLLPQLISFAGLVGGSAHSHGLTKHIVADGKNLPVMQRFSHKLKQIYQSFVKRLNTMGKDLNQATKTQIEGVFTSLSQKEDGILHFLQLLGRYAAVSRQDGNVVKGDVTQKELENAYKRYETNMGKLQKRAHNMISIISALATGTNDSEKDNVPLQM